MLNNKSNDSASAIAVRLCADHRFPGCEARLRLMTTPTVFASFVLDAAAAAGPSNSPFFETARLLIARRFAAAHRTRPVALHNTMIIAE